MHNLCDVFQLLFLIFYMNQLFSQRTLHLYDIIVKRDVAAQLKGMIINKIHILISHYIDNHKNKLQNDYLKDIPHLLDSPSVQVFPLGKSHVNN